MKNLNRFNLFLVGILVVLGLLGFVEPGCWFIGALATIPFGAFQFIVGTGMLIDSGGKDVLLQIYFAGAVLFFALWIAGGWFWIIALPPALAVYLSVILYIKAKNRQS